MEYLSLFQIIKFGDALIEAFMPIVIAVFGIGIAYKIANLILFSN